MKEDEAINETHNIKAFGHEKLIFIPQHLKEVQMPAYTSNKHQLLTAALVELHFCSTLIAVSLFTCPGWRFHVRAVCQWSAGCPTSETHNVNGSGIPDWSEKTWNPSGNHHHGDHTVADQNKSKTGSWSTLEPRPPHQMSPLYSD